MINAAVMHGELRQRGWRLQSAAPSRHLQYSNTISASSNPMQSPYRILAAAGLDRGDRDHQQDQFALWSHARDEGCVLGVIADGMGGLTGGRAAAKQIILTAQQHFDAYDPQSKDGTGLLHDIAIEAHTLIRMMAVASEQEPHSTVAAFLLGPDRNCYTVYCGDSRVYRFARGTLTYQSTDHSQVQALVAQGLLDASKANAHPMANVLTSCLGTAAEPMIMVKQMPPLAIGDAVLLCSDGLWHYFTTEELALIIEALAPDEAVRMLVTKARERAGGQGDNLSLVLLKIEASVDSG